MMMQSMKNRENPANIWDVVTSLAQALTDARDQLVDLIKFDGSAKGIQNRRGHGMDDTDSPLAMRLRGGGSSHRVPDNQRVRSIHRQHARGHVAFGNHSEFKPEPPGKPETMAMNWSCYRRGSEKGRGIQMYLKGNSLKINNERGCESPVSVFIPKSPDSACGRESRPRSLYECKRHCIGTQYAALLTEEACRARERRMAKTCERINCKPRWARG